MSAGGSGVVVVATATGSTFCWAGAEVVGTVAGTVVGGGVVDVGADGVGSAGCCGTGTDS